MKPRAVARWRGAALAIVLVAAACSGGSSETTPSTSSSSTTSSTTTTTTTPVPVLDTHTMARLDSLAAFEAYAAGGAGGQEVVKFTIAEFLEEPTVEFLDGNFYSLHDEWFWYRLLNGEVAPGSSVAPVEGLEFDSIAEVYTWAEPRDPDTLPLGLRFTADGRLYAPQYYEAALDDVDNRVYGVGSIVRVPARTEEPAREELWLISLEHGDEASAAQIERYFEVLISAVDPGLGDRLLWATRSLHQEQVADELRAAGGPYAERVMNFSDLAVPGESETYNAGVAIGRLRRIAPGADELTESRPGDVLLIEQAPDWLPPAAALVTASPQTPLAHVNILASNRGIPNGYLGGAIDDLDLAQLGAARAPVAVRADESGVTIVPLTDQQFRDLQRVTANPETAVPSVAIDELELAQALSGLLPSGEEALSEETLEGLRPRIGGKAVGMLALLDGDVVTPEHPTAITIRPYVQHLGNVMPALEALLADRDFSTSAAIRYLALEGEEDYDARYTSAMDAAAKAAFGEQHDGDVIGDVLDAGGFKRYFRDVPIEPETLAAIEAHLAENFADHSPEQGLRFRSSSSVEDIDGFNGAGLYDSNTGFLQPDPDSADERRTRSVEWALLKTWASYWSAEAFEERELERIDHLSGNMAVLVHARFDDEIELSNGVFTFAIASDGSRVLELNAQLGAESVTNPSPESNIAPEVVTVTSTGGDDDDIDIERVSPSSLSIEPLLSDEQLAEIFTAAVDVATKWLDRLNVGLDEPQHRTTLTLDFEFREVDSGWPALAGDAEPHPSRVVIKQARPLEPGLRHLSAEVLELPVPRDVLARAALIERVTCVNEEFVRVQTRELSTPDFGYSQEPLIVVLTEEETDDDPGECEFDVLYGAPSTLLEDLFEQLHEAQEPEASDSE